jgi:O-antigen/teichoic acid export membrane protein
MATGCSRWATRTSRTRAARNWALDAAWALAAVVPLALTKEFARDYAFAHFRMARALTLDATVASIQLAVLGWLALTGRMSALAAYGALGLACGIAAVWHLSAARAEFASGAGPVRAVMRQSWDLGKWLLASRAAVLVQGYATYWLSSVVAGAAVTGLYAACMSVVSFVNPILFGLWNFLTPRSVLAWKDGGGAGLRRRAVRDLALLGGLTGSFCILVLLVGDDAMRLLYPGRDYDGQGHVVAVLALAILVWALSIPASSALASMERPRPMAAISALSAALNVVLVWRLMPEWGLPGAAYAVLAANTVGTLGRWAVFLAALRTTRLPQ